MKIVLDISMTEYTAMMSKVTEGAKAQVELEHTRTTLYEATSKVSTLSYDLQRSKECVESIRSDRKYYTDRCEKMIREIQVLQEQLRVTTAPKPKYTLDEMGKLLAKVRDAIPMVNGGQLSEDPFFNDLVRKAANNEKISMIKDVRTATQCGLKEAKDLVDGIVWDMHSSWHYDGTIATVIAENRPKNFAEVIAANS